MLKRSVIAADITNLTDARYFASMGVDYLMYNPSDISIHEIGAIKEWVEGVKTLIVLDSSNVHLIEEILLRIKPDAVGASDKFSFGRVTTYINNGPVFYHFDKGSPTSKVVLTDVDNIDEKSFHIADPVAVKTFSDEPFTLERINAFLKESENVGIILRGSAEIETGLKSFEAVDLILEALEDLE